MQIIHLPNGYWKLSNGKAVSPTFNYSEQGVWFWESYVYIGQTSFYGEEKVWIAVNPISIFHESIDASLPAPVGQL